MPAKYTFEQSVAKFWERVDKSGGEDACWLWTSFCSRDGYGHVWWNGRMDKSHRVAWRLTYSDPGELFVLHNCPDGDNPRCCNPAHLWLGTNQENMDDMRDKGRNNKASGEHHGMAKLTREQVTEIRRLYAEGGRTQKSIGDMYGVCFSTISLIVLGKHWKS